MFKKILIANRGEIAVRVMRTCREMGIATVAVYSDADRTALHVQNADECVYLGPSEPLESYLNMERILEAARQTGAEAIHPGYGFLAENPVFAERCQKAGFIFIGPPAKVIRDLGDKTISRTIMKKGSVPVIPGMMETTEDFSVIQKKADAIGYPVLVKAAAGGGGKGMRVVPGPEELKEACESAQSEALKAFGNPAIYLEKYLVRPRHVEIQVLADQFGNTIHLAERECSIQRRHQKIIEETPSPALTPELREAMGKAAVAAARAAGYVNAGTVEFLLDERGHFYFLEVNTRLQVEHPITEMVTGLDLVREQILIAAGQALPYSQDQIKTRGHALECRIYAEDPESAFMPSPGKILFLKEPEGPGIRVDSGIYGGFTVPIAYDPILSKLVAFAEDRERAIARMIRALSEYVILGLKTPIPFLLDVMKSPAFKSGKTHTWFLDDEFGRWKPDQEKTDLACLAYMVHEQTPQPVSQELSQNALEGFRSPWETLGPWSL